VPKRLGAGAPEGVQAGFTVEAIDGDIGKVDEATYDVGGSYIVVDTVPGSSARR
jgi:hypothetical protein